MVNLPNYNYREFRVDGVDINEFTHSSTDSNKLGTLTARLMDSVAETLRLNESLHLPDLYINQSSINH